MLMEGLTRFLPHLAATSLTVRFAQAWRARSRQACLERDVIQDAGEAGFTHHYWGYFAHLAKLALAHMAWIETTAAFLAIFPRGIRSNPRIAGAHILAKAAVLFGKKGRQQGRIWQGLFSREDEAMTKRLNLKYSVRYLTMAILTVCRSAVLRAVPKALGLVDFCAV